MFFLIVQKTKETYPFDAGYSIDERDCKRQEYIHTKTTHHRVNDWQNRNNYNGRVIILFLDEQQRSLSRVFKIKLLQLLSNSGICLNKMPFQSFAQIHLIGYSG